MILIKETLEEVSCTYTLNEAKEKQFFIEGVFLQSELKNRNGRMYPEKIMDSEVKRYNEEYVNKNRAYGELGHPENPSINLDRVSHLIKSLRKEGTNYVGKAQILDTPMGKIARGLLEGGANLGVSSRALGSLKTNNEGIQIVQDDFLLSTAADIVADPSGPNCFVRGIMEGHEWIFVDGKFVEKHIEETRRNIKIASSKNLDEAKIKAFTYFLSKIQ